MSHDKERDRKYGIKYRANHPELVLYNSTMRAELKLEVLTHYGPNSSLGCCWEDCEVTDIDMLTLDHINDDGHKHLSKSGKKHNGRQLYSWAKKNLYPNTLQTLCGSHQLKKLIEAHRDKKFAV